MDIKGFSVESDGDRVYVLVRDSDASNAASVREQTFTMEEWKSINDAIGYGVITAQQALGFEPPTVEPKDDPAGEILIETPKRSKK